MSLARFVTFLSLLTFTSVVPLVAAQQVELHLRTGAVVKGDLISEDNDKVVVKSTAIGKSGKAMSMTMPYKRADIAEVITLADPETVYQTKSAAAKTADDFLALAQWCREQGMVDQAVEHAKKSLALDATQESAKTLLGDLGWVMVDGKWLKEADALAAQGKVRVQGKIMTLAEAEALKASAQQQAAAADAQRAADDKAGSLAAIDRQLAELPKRSAQIDTSLVKATTDLATAQGLAQKVTSAKAAVDSAQQSLDQARAANQNNAGANNGGLNGGANTQQYTQALENAQKALIAARRDAGSADAQLAQAKAKIASLTDEKKNLDKKREDLTAKREAAVKALEQAKAADAAAKAGDKAGK